MSSFINKLINRKFNLGEEILSIEKLFDGHKPYESSIKSIVEGKFIKWQHRSNFIKLSDMIDKMGINDIILSAKNNNVSLDDFIYYVEYMYNLLFAITEKDFTNIEQRDKFIAIFENIFKVLNQINFEVVECQSDGYFKIVEKDWKVSQAADIIQDRYDLGEKLYLYRHYSMKGKLFDKADILCRLYKVFEDGKESKLKANQFTTLASDIGFLSDRLDLRHAPNAKEKILLEGLTREEQENWYDELFVLYLDMLILCDHIDKRKDTKELRKKLANIKP